MAKKTGFSIMSALNAQSLAGDAHAANEFIVEDIPLEEIEPNADNFYNTEDIESLAADIQQNGLMHNIKVCSKGENGMYKLISGERRYRAFALLKEQGNEGYDTIPATVDPEENPLMVKLKLISANASARVLSDYEKAEQAAQIEDIARQLKQQGAELPGRVREIAAQALGVSTAQAGRLTKIAHDLVPEVKEKFAAGEIGVTEAYDVATLPAEQQAQAVEARAEKVTEDKPSFLSQDDIDAFLMLNVSKRIADIYGMNAQVKDALSALKKELLNSGATFDFCNLDRGYYDCKPNGINFRNLSTKEDAVLSWTAAHKRILELIAEGIIAVTPDESAEEHAEAVLDQQEAEKPSAATLPEQTNQVLAGHRWDETWMDVLDDYPDLLSAALCIEHWNEMARHKPEFELLKKLILREADMRKKRTE